MSKYSIQWQGLDQGVEHTWQPEVIEAVAKEIAKLGTVEHTNPQSPLYARIHELFPGKTWVSRGSDGSARTIFRRSNTWARLGLAEVSRGTMRLTPLGESFVVGDVSVADVLSDALASHEEDGERPFSIIASAFLEKPSRAFTLEDLENGVMGNYRPGVDSIDEALSTQNTAGGISPTRKRRIRAMVSRLEDVQAIAARGEGWALKDFDVLSKIAGRSAQVRLAAEIATEALADHGQEPMTPRRSDPSLSSRQFQPSTPNFTANIATVRAANPLKRRELLEKASVGHAHLLRYMADFLQSRGLTPTEDPFSYDLACINGAVGWIFEAKTCTEANVKDQIRKAIAQLYEYRWRGRAAWPTDTKLAIIIDKSPLGLVEDWVFDFLYEDRGILLLWYDEGIFKVKNAETGAVENFGL